MDHGREPCPDRILDDIGGAFGMGAIGGGMWHTYKGLRNSPRGFKMIGTLEVRRAVRRSWRALRGAAPPCGQGRRHVPLAAPCSSAPPARSSPCSRADHPARGAQAGRQLRQLGPDVLAVRLHLPLRAAEGACSSSSGPAQAPVRWELARPAHGAAPRAQKRLPAAAARPPPLPQEDPFNAIIAGTLTGGFLQLRSGLRPAFRSAVFGGVLLVSGAPAPPAPPQLLHAPMRSRLPAARPPRWAGPPGLISGTPPPCAAPPPQALIEGMGITLQKMMSPPPPSMPMQQPLPNMPAPAAPAGVPELPPLPAGAELQAGDEGGFFGKVGSWFGGDEQPKQVRLPALGQAPAGHAALVGVVGQGTRAPYADSRATPPRAALPQEAFKVHTLEDDAFQPPPMPQEFRSK